jgi:Flp pilus assembly protein TadB
MRKFVMSAITLAALLMPQANLMAGRGHGTGAAIAAGLIGTAMITSAAASSSRSRARRAEEEAREARMKAEAVQQQQQREQVYGVQRQLERQYMSHQVSRTMNIMIFAIVLLSLGLLTLGIMLFKRK